MGVLLWIGVGCGKGDHHHDHGSSETQFPADSFSADKAKSWHGNRITEEGASPAAELTTLMAGTTEKAGLKLSGEVTKACQKKGCWMNVKLNDSTEMRVAFKDYGFFVPKDAAGQKVTLSGRAYLDTTSVEDLVHFATDEGMTEADAKAKYTQPQVQLAFEADGVVLSK